MIKAGGSAVSHQTNFITHGPLDGVWLPPSCAAFSNHGPLHVPTLFFCRNRPEENTDLSALIYSTMFVFRSRRRRNSSEPINTRLCSSIFLPAPPLLPRPSISIIYEPLSIFSRLRSLTVGPYLIWLGLRSEIRIIDIAA